MSTIVTRVGKGSPLTWTEVDSNFTNLNTDKLQSGDTAASLTITSATINGGTITGITDLAVADGGTGLSSLTAGYIPFGAGTSAFGSSANLFWDNTNSRLGIGTASPSEKLTVYNSASVVFSLDSDTGTNLRNTRYTSDASSPFLTLRKARGTLASPTAVNSGDGLGTIQFVGYGGTNYRGLAYISGTVGTYTSDTNISSLLSFSTTPTGSITPSERMRIDSSGNVGIGTTSLVGKLNVGSGRSFFGANSETYSIGVGYTQARVNSGQTYYIGATDSATPDLVFSNASGTERMRIHASGGVSIGNTTDSGAASLNVSGSMSGGYIAHADGTTAMAFGADNVVRVTPNATATYTSTVPAAGAICVLSILTSGTTSYTITFGTGFKSTGTLATGTVSARYFNITFVSDGTNLIETSRTVAIA